jgi:hypothetical protein
MARETEVMKVMDVRRIDAQARVADLSFRQGCLACGGELEVRATPYGSWSHCRNCHWLSRSKLSWTPAGIQLMHPTAVV